MRTKVAVAVAAVVLILASAGGIVWYVSVPHSAEEQLAVAEKMYKKLNADSVTHKYPENKAEVEATIKAYRDVAVWKKPDATYEGLKRIEQIEQEIVKSDSEAIKVWQEIIKAYPEEERGGAGMMAMEGLIRKQADGLKSVKKDEEANARYKDAIGVLEDYLKKYPQGKLADAATIEQGRIWQDGIGDPLANAIAIYEKFLKVYITSEYVPEAMYRLAQILQTAKAEDRAMALYSELLEKYPKSKWADKALFERGKLLAAKMKPDEAEKDFDKLSKEFPDSPLKGEAQGAAKQAKGDSAKQANEKYGKSRYGGTVPYDTSADKPMPPAGMLKVYAKEKLDAQDYDLDIAFEPSDHKMSVKGWMTLINKGDEKTQLLLLLGAGMKVTTCNVDGVAAKNELNGVQWRIILPTVMKTGALSKIDFAYSCQMAGPKPGMGFGKIAVKPDAAPDVGPGGDSTTQPATDSATTQAASQPAEEHFPYDPQLALGEYGYGLSGGNFYPVTIIGDLFNAHVHATVPAGDEVVFSGGVVKRAIGTGTTRGEFEFKTSRPIFGLYFAYGKYVVAQKVVNGITYYTYLKEINKDKSEAYVKTASDILNFYSERYTAFPYEKLALVEVPLPPFLGGVGPASLMFLHQGMVMQHDVPEFLLAHELAHQWFGNLIPINMTDPAYNQWLSEGFATYSDALYSQQTGPADSMARHMQKYAQLYFEQSLAFPRAAERPIKETFQNSPMYRPMIYEKGAMVLHALRKVVGDEHFFTIMRRYVTECKDKLTTVDDFRRLAQEVGGKDLSIFFSQWIDRPGFAHWVIRAADMEAAAAGGAGTTTAPSASAAIKVTLDINQPDDLFVMPADITYHGDAGQVFVQKDVMLDQIEQKVTATVPFKPVKIVIDEDYWVMHHPGEDNVWTASATAVK